MAVFPESAILGWINPEAHDLAHPIPGGDSDRLCAMAATSNIGIVIGLDEKVGDALYGAALALSPSGEILAHHRKANVLPYLMSPPYSEGPRATATFAPFPFGKVAILVCADTFLPETIAAVKEGAPDLLAVPYGWVSDSDDFYAHGAKLSDLVRSLAEELGCPVIGVDAVGTVGHGPWAGRRYCGASVAANRFGIQVSQTQIGTSFVQTIDFDS